MTRKASGTPPQFHKRFNIDFGLEEAKQRFMVRVSNEVQPFIQKADSGNLQIRLRLATLLGTDYYQGFSILPFLKRDFYTCLEALEKTHQALRESWMGEDRTDRFSRMLEEIISLSEVDLGVRWRNGRFYLRGARLLDEKLVNESLQWLSDPPYNNVLGHFEKGLTDFTQAQNNPQRREDVIGEMFKTLESMARIVCNNRKGWKANAEQFVSKLGLSTHYSKMLQDHGDYLHEFRHGSQPDKPRTPPSPQEAEASIYTTGLFLRLAIERLASK